MRSFYTSQNKYMQFSNADFESEVFHWKFQGSVEQLQLDSYFISPVTPTVKLDPLDGQCRPY